MCHKLSCEVLSVRTIIIYLMFIQMVKLKFSCFLEFSCFLDIGTPVPIDSHNHNDTDKTDRDTNAFDSLI